ncbi:MAG: hypothetical protein HUU22_10655 [Phycisphaerae bacterium]|nr:hypothetical protein [Phycisphaerae bacterium]NUQ46481.1 hypothetical protein [Phycisphaerae bacterium]
MREKQFPPGWDEHRERRALEHYEQRSEDEAAAEDEAAIESPGSTLMGVPNEIVAAVRELIQKTR